MFLDMVEVGAMPLVLTDAAIEEFLISSQEDFLVGVRFPFSSTVYTYLAPSSVRVGSLVRVPSTVVYPKPQVATVVTLSPPFYSGSLSRILEVLS